MNGFQFELVEGSVVVDSESYQKFIAERCAVDLTSPQASAVFPAVVVVDGQIKQRCVVSTTSPEIIRACQSAMSDVLSAALQMPITLPIDGVYDCDTAGNMTAIAQLLEQPGVGEVRHWPLGRRETVYLLNQSKDLQRAARAALEPVLGYPIDGIAVQISYNDAVGTFKPAPVPGPCGIEHQHVDDPQIIPGGLETTSYLDGAGAPSGSTSSGASSIGFAGWALIGFAAVGAGALVHKYFIAPKGKLP